MTGDVGGGTAGVLGDGFRLLRSSRRRRRCRSIRQPITAPACADSHVHSCTQAGHVLHRMPAGATQTGTAPLLQVDRRKVMILDS